MYRSIVNTTIQETLSMLFLKRNIKTRIQLAKPNAEDIVNRNATSKEEIVRRSFRPGDEVLVRYYRKRHEKWIPGSVIREIGNVDVLNFSWWNDMETTHWSNSRFHSLHNRENGYISCGQSLQYSNAKCFRKRSVDTPPPFDTSVSSQTSVSDNNDKRVYIQCVIPE